MGQIFLTAACLREINLNKLCQEGILARAVAGTGDARGQRDSVRRVLALVGGRAQPDVLLRVRSDLALDLGHLHSLVVARVLVEQDL